jgi:dihydroorotase
MRFDVVIHGGDVIDPGGGNDGRLDVAIADGRVAAVDTQIPPSAGASSIDASGHYVTPGLVDLHTHVYNGATFWGIDPNPIAARSGVTTWIDAGSAGAFGLDGLKWFIADQADVRVMAFVNLSSIGLVALDGELAVPEYLDIDACVDAITRHSGFACGVKARIDRGTVGPLGLDPLRRAREAAERVGLPMMVHLGPAPPEVDGVVSMMRPGDILTHCAIGSTMRILDERGELRDSVRRAVDAGVLLDIGHGVGSFSWDVAEGLENVGVRPDVISSDIHRLCLERDAAFDLLNCLNKYLYLGLDLRTVIAASTVRAAEAIGLGDGIGTLRVGAQADVAVLELQTGSFPLFDTSLVRRDGRQALRCVTTISCGRVLDMKAVCESDAQ